MRCYPAGLRKQRTPQPKDGGGPALSFPRWASTAVLAASLILLAGIFSTELADPDVWWHLRTGQFIAEQHRLPVPDPFSYTSAAPEAYPGEERTRYFNLTHEWLSQLVWYGIYRAGGFPGLVLWKALLLTAFCGMCGFVTARRAASWGWGLFAAWAAASLAVVFTADRPALVTFFFTALFITVFETGRGVWALPVLSLVWANAHGGFFLGWIVCGAYAIDQRTKKRWAVTAACVLASSVNPNRLGVIETLLRYRQSYLTSTLIEWSRPHLWGPPYAFDILLYAAAVTLLISWRRVRIADWMLFAAFAAAALVAFRNMILIAFLAPILIGSYLPRPRFRAWAPYACAAAAAALAVLLLSRGRLFELRAAEWRYPAGAARFLDAHNVTAPLFNTYEYGGYLIWKGRRVFIDGRALSEAVYQRYLKALRTEPGDRTLAATLGAYQIGAIVMNAFEYTSGALYPLALTLAGEPEWKLVYDDPQAMVFLRETPTGMQVIDKARILDHLERECALHIANDPEFPLCARTLADLFLRLGNRNRARNALALYLSHTREEDREARRAYRQLIRMR